MEIILVYGITGFVQRNKDVMRTPANNHQRQGWYHQLSPILILNQVPLAPVVFSKSPSPSDSTLTQDSTVLWTLTATHDHLH
jgi:hypothetical protein